MLRLVTFVLAFCVASGAVAQPYWSCEAKSALVRKRRDLYWACYETRGKAACKGKRPDAAFRKCVDTTACESERTDLDEAEASWQAACGPRG